MGNHNGNCKKYEITVASTFTANRKEALKYTLPTRKSQTQEMEM